MYRRILLLLDLEGVNRVVGEPYMGLQRDTAQWEVARQQAVLEVNAAAEALFDAGAEKVGLWDNHGGGNNVDPTALDPRIEWITPAPHAPRMDFAKGEYDCVCFFGYHTMEGTLGGVLAHTMNSKAVQYYKLNGRYVGEVDMDGYIAASHGIPCCFFAGGDIACRQAERALEGISTVVTKTELGRNEASFRDNEALLKDIKKTVVAAVQGQHCPQPLQFPATMEKSFKRIEDAAKYLSALRALGINAAYPDDDILGKDAHTVVSTIYDIGEMIKCL